MPPKGKKPLPSGPEEDRNYLKSGDVVGNIHGREICVLGPQLGKGKFGKVFAVDRMTNSSSSSSGGGSATGTSFISSIMGKVGSIGGLGNNNYAMAIKTVSLPKNDKDKIQASNANSLFHEYTLLQNHFSKFPMRARTPDNCYGKDLVHKVAWIIMERLDQDLLEYSKSNAMTPSVIGHIGTELLSGLRWLHDKKFIYVDMKPQNIMFKDGKFYFIDFGCVESIRTFNFGAMMPPEVVQEREAAVGTPLYNSLRTLLKENPGKRDDLESMALVLLSLMSDESGTLPWSRAPSLAELPQIMERTDLRQVATSKHVGELAEIVYHCRELTDDTPDYERIGSWLDTIKKRSSSISSSSKSSKSTEDKNKSSSSNSSNSNKSNVKDDKSSNSISHVDNSSSKKSAPAASTAIPRPGPPSSSVRLQRVPTVIAEEASPEVRSKRKRHIENVVKLVTSADYEQLQVDHDKDALSPSPSKSFKLASPASGGSARSARKPSNRNSSSSSSSIIDLTRNGEVKYELYVLSGALQGTRLKLNFEDQDEFFLGRDPEADVFFEDNKVSANHLRIHPADSHFYSTGIAIMDQGSINGTLINGTKIHKKRWVNLLSGSIVTLGDETALLLKEC